MANSTAPVCPISRDQPIPAQAPPWLIPPFQATNLPSLIQAVNNAISNLNRLLGPGLPVNNLHVPGIRVQPQPSSVNIQSWWYETDRNTDDGFIYNYDSNTGFDRSQKVEVTRIYGVEFSPAGASINGVMDWYWQEQPYTQGALQ